MPQSHGRRIECHTCCTILFYMSASRTIDNKSGGSMSRGQTLNEVIVEDRSARMNSRGDSEFVYVNSAYVGSVNNVSVQNERTASAQPITGVYREQYWACSRWPYTQRVLAIAVGVLLGAFIGLVLSMILGGDDSTVIGPIFQRNIIQK